MRRRSCKFSSWAHAESSSSMRQTIRGKNSYAPRRATSEVISQERNTMKSKLNGKVEANTKVLHPDDHSHARQTSPLEADKPAVKEYTEWQKGRKGRGTK